MPTTSLMPLPKLHFETAIGTPLVGGKVYTYAAGTTNQKATYTDAAGTTPHENPIQLNLRGEPPSAIYWSGNYRVDLRDALGNLVYSVDNYNTDPAGIWDTMKNLAAAAGATLIGYLAAVAGAVKRTIAAKLSETVSPQDVGAVIGEDCTDALKKFFAALASGKAGVMPPGVYDYNIAAGGPLAVDCTSFILKASGATIRCSGYPQLGATQIADFVTIRTDNIYLDGLTVDGGWQSIAGRVDDYCRTNNLFDYMQGLAISADAGFIDNITVHDVQGLGFTTETSTGGMSNVQIGKVTAFYNWMIGVDFRSLQNYVQDVTVAQILAHNNGTRGGGWVQVNIGDCTATSGSVRMSIGSVIANDGGGSGIGVGQYAKKTDGAISGGRDISIDSITAKGNKGHGAELYASTSVHVGRINAIENDGKGVYVERSDTNDVFAYVNSIGEIAAVGNGQDGVLISGITNLQIGSITAWNNSTKSANSSGLAIYAATGLPIAETGQVQIGMVRCFDDRAPADKTQAYGIGVSFYGVSGGYVSIGSTFLSGNKTQDLAWLVAGASTLIAFGDLTYDTLFPNYADNWRVQMAVGGKLVQRWRTTDAAAIAPLIARPTPGRDCLAVTTVIGRKSDGTVLHFTQDIAPFKWTGAAFQKQVGTMQQLAYKTGATDSYLNEFGTAVGSFVQGLAGTTIDWEITMEFSTGIDRTFAI